MSLWPREYQKQDSSAHFAFADLAEPEYADMTPREWVGVGVSRDEIRADVVRDSLAESIYRQRIS